MPDQISGFLSPFLRERRFKAVLPLIRGKVLDYGCGIGLLAARVSVDDYTGVDLDADSIEIARKRHSSFRFYTLDEYAGRGPYDTVVALALIEHVPDPARLVRELRAQLKPGGRIVMTTPNPYLDWAHGLGAALGLFSRSGHAEHQSLLDRRAIHRLAEDTELDVVRYERFLWGANQLFVLQKND